MTALEYITGWKRLLCDILKDLNSNDYDMEILCKTELKILKKLRGNESLEKSNCILENIGHNTKLSIKIFV